MNRESYNAIAPDWDAARASFVHREREYLDTLLDGLPANAHVLDLGCGSGRPIAEYVLSAGLRVTGVDQAEALLDIARARYPNGTWIHGCIEAFVTQEKFDAIVCWDTLFHVDRRQHRPLFERFAAMLNGGGRLMATFGGSDHPAFTDTMFGRPFHYDSHPPEKELDIIRRTGFTPVISEFMNPPTSGRDKGRYAIVARIA